MPSSSLFTVLEETFRLLGTHPCPLALDGQQLGCGLPARQIPIVELRALLTAPAASSDLQHHIITAVLGRIHQHPVPWTVVLGGLLLPALRFRAEQITTSDKRLAGEVETQLLWRVHTAAHRPSRHAYRFAMDLLQFAPTSGTKRARSPILTASNGHAR